MVLRTVRLFLFFLGGLLVLISPVQAETKLAVIKKAGIVITTKDLKRIIDYYGEEARRYLAIPEKKAEFLENIVKIKALAACARRQGFNKRPEIQQEISFLVDKFLARKYLQEKLNQEMAKVKISEQDLRLYYKTHQDEFTIPAKIRFSGVIIKATNASKKEELQRLSRKLREQLISGKLKEIPSFQDLNIFLIGDSGWSLVKRFPPQVRDILQKLPLGKYSDIIEVGREAYIIKIIERQKTQVLPFEKVKERIKNKLLDEIRTNKTKEIIKQILTDEGTEIYYQNL